MTSKDPPTLTNLQLLTALRHHTRAQLLQILSERTGTPKNLARELGRPIRHVEYHLKILEGLGCVELFKTEKSAGGRVIAHHYRAFERLWFDRESWRDIDPAKQPPITMDILRLMSDDLRVSLLAGLIDDRDNHISRTPLVLDALGYEDLLETLSDTLDRVVEIQAEASDRLEDDDPPIMTKVHIVQFLSPDPQ